MSIEAMKLALEAVQDLRGYRPDIDSAIETLRTAIQQAEAQQPATAIACGIPGMAKTTCPYCEQGFAFEHEQPATGEPVVGPFVATYSSESIGGKQHDTGRVNKGPRGGFFASTASVEDASLIADALNAYTHPAPSVPGDDFDLICNAIDKADTITMEGDYMLDSDDCIAVVRVMQVLLSVRDAMIAAKEAT